MGLKKIADIPTPCLHPEHNPPSMIVLSPGVYEHTCPGCGHSVTFTVYGTVCETPSKTFPPRFKCPNEGRPCNCTGACMGMKPGGIGAWYSSGSLPRAVVP